MTSSGGRWEAATSLSRQSWGPALTVSGLQAIGEAQGQVTFRQELSCFLSKANYHHGKVFCFFQLQREAVVTGVGCAVLSREGNTVTNLGTVGRKHKQNSSSHWDCRQRDLPRPHD